MLQVNIIYLILIKYSIASALTIFSSENFTNIAWDSAGVTTGPVTVRPPLYPLHLFKALLWLC